VEFEQIPVVPGSSSLLRHRRCPRRNKVHCELCKKEIEKEIHEEEKKHTMISKEINMKRKKYVRLSYMDICSGYKKKCDVYY
jgi:hypothetical protein